MQRYALLLVLYLFQQICFAQELHITNARLIDGLGGIIDGGELSVSDGRIVAIGTTVEAPEEATVIDAAGMTVMPGMINTHWHLLAGSAASNVDELDEYLESANRIALEEILERGVTTIMSPGDHFPYILEVTQKLENGVLRDPRLFVVGPVFTSPGDWPTQICAGNADCTSLLTAEVSTAEQVRGKVRELAEAGVDAVKLVYDDMIAADTRIDDAVVAAIADEAERHGLRLLAHLSSTTVPASVLIDLGVDAFVHAAMDISGAVPVMRERNIPVITTAATFLRVSDRSRVDEPEFLARQEPFVRLTLENIRTLQQENVPVAFGTDAIAGPRGLPPGFFPTTASGDGLFMAEARLLRRALSNAEIIASLTHNAAVFLGMEDRFGSLGPGKIADIVIIDGDPIANISNLEHVRVVIQGGSVKVDRR